MGYVIMYLAAIVLANLSVAHFGPASTIVNAFLFIGLDLTARDKLHNAWRDRHLVAKMAALIVAGSVMTYALNHNAGQVCVASVVAFALAAVGDSIVYHVTDNINKSNVVSAAIDSLVFPWLAFGGVMPLVSLGQWLAKVAGGWVWALILKHITSKA